MLNVGKWNARSDSSCNDGISYNARGANAYCMINVGTNSQCIGNNAFNASCYHLKPLQFKIYKSQGIPLMQYKIHPTKR